METKLIQWPKGPQRSNWSIRLGQWILPAACGLVMAFSVAITSGQMINVQTPFHTAGDSFHERIGIGFGFNFGGGGRIRGLSPTGQILPRVTVSQGSFNNTIPGFGGFRPNSGLNTGFATVGGDVDFSFALTAAKGNRRSMVSQAPSVTVMNGQSGSIFSGENRPFVTRINPVSGWGGGTGVSLIRPPIDLSSESLLESSRERSRNASKREDNRTYSDPHSTAAQGALSLSEIERRREQQERLESQQAKAEVMQLIATADDLVKQGKKRAARAKYSRALRKIADQSGTEALRAELRQKSTLSATVNRIVSISSFFRDPEGFADRSVQLVRFDANSGGERAAADCCFDCGLIESHHSQGLHSSFNRDPEWIRT